MHNARVPRRGGSWRARGSSPWFEEREEHGVTRNETVFLPRGDAAFGRVALLSLSGDSIMKSLWTFLPSALLVPLSASWASAPAASRAEASSPAAPSQVASPQPQSELAATPATAPISPAPPPEPSA